MTDYLTTAEAARLIGHKSTSGITAAAIRGDIEGYKTPLGHWRLNRESVIAYGARPQLSRRAQVINTGFTEGAVDRNVPKTELEMNRALLDARIKAAKVTEAVYLDSSGQEVSRRKWLGL